MQNTEQISSTIGSLKGSVTIESGKDVEVKASDVIAKQNINITGENVNIESADNTYNAQEKHEFKQSGLTVSLESQTINTYKKVYDSVERAGQVSDDRLKALYAYKAGEDYKDIKKQEKTAKALKEKQEAEEAKKQEEEKNKQGADKSANDGAEKKPAQKSDISISVSLGTSKSESSSTSQTTVAQGSSITGGDNVKIKSTKGDIKVKGSDITGENVTLDAKKNIEITASENKNTSKTDSKSSSASIGASINLGDGSIGGINVSGSKQTGAIKENSTTYNQSTVTANDNLIMNSGKDTDIKGSKVSGDKVKVTAGENLNLESLQDKETYDEKNSSAGGTIGVGTFNASASKGKINSDYESVTKQAEIHAGQGGFDIEVVKNLDLKGAVISSDATPDKNKISTDTLTYSDIENKADYSASSTGVSFETTTTNKVKDVNGKKTIVSEKGITGSPDISMPVTGSASSTTKSAIANGVIEVRSGNTDLSNLSRNTSDAINALGKIFDKKKVQEQQELTKIFGQEAFKAVGDLALKQYQKALSDAAKADKAGDKTAYNEAMARAYSWDDGGTNKILLHAVAGGIMSSLGGGSFTSGATAAGLNEAVQNELAKIKDPGLHQLASAAIGAAASKLVGGNAQTGASTASNGTKYNWLTHFEQMKFAALLKRALDSKDEKQAINIITYYTAKSSDNIGNSTLEDLALMRDDEIIEGRLYEQLIRVITISTTASLNPTLNELSTTIYGPNAANRANAYKDILNSNSSYDPFVTPPEVEIEIKREYYNAEVAKANAAREAEKEASPGDYAYKYEGVKPERYYEDGTAAVHLEDGDHPAYTAPTRGEVLAEASDAQFTKIDGKWYVVDPENAEKCWYTTKEPSAWQIIKQAVATDKEEKDINFYDAELDLAKRNLKSKGIDPEDPKNANELANEVERQKEITLGGVTGSVGGVGVKVLKGAVEAEQVASQLNGVLTKLKNGWKIEVPNGSKSIVVRIMDEGAGGRAEPYFRVSINGKGSLTLEGQLSSDRGLTHVDMNDDYLKQITNMINKYLGSE